MNYSERKQSPTNRLSLLEREIRLMRLLGASEEVIDQLEKMKKEEESEVNNGQIRSTTTS